MDETEPEYVYLTLRVQHGGWPPWGRRLAWLLKILGRFGFKNEGCSTTPTTKHLEARTK